MYIWLNFDRKSDGPKYFQRYSIQNFTVVKLDLPDKFDLDSLMFQTIRFPMQCDINLKQHI